MSFVLKNWDLVTIACRKYKFISFFLLKEGAREEKSCPKFFCSCCFCCLGWCISRFPVAVVKYHDWKQLEERVYVALQFQRG